MLWKLPWLCGAYNSTQVATCLVAGERTPTLLSLRDRAQRIRSKIRQPNREPRSLQHAVKQIKELVSAEEGLNDSQGRLGPAHQGHGGGPLAIVWRPR